MWSAGLARKLRVCIVALVLSAAAGGCSVAFTEHPHVSSMGPGLRCTSSPVLPALDAAFAALMISSLVDDGQSGSDRVSLGAAGAAALASAVYGLEATQSCRRALAADEQRSYSARVAEWRSRIRTEPTPASVVAKPAAPNPPPPPPEPPPDPHRVHLTAGALVGVFVPAATWRGPVQPLALVRPGLLLQTQQWFAEAGLTWARNANYGLVAAHTSGFFTLWSGAERRQELYVGAGAGYATATFGGVGGRGFVVQPALGYRLFPRRLRLSLRAELNYLHVLFTEAGERRLTPVPDEGVRPRALTLSVGIFGD